VAGGAGYRWRAWCVSGPAPGRACSTDCAHGEAAPASGAASPGTDYRDLMVLIHHQLDAPLVWVWDNRGVHSTGELKAFIAEHKQWLRVFHLPSYAPDLNPTEGVWSLLKRSVANLAAANLDHLVRVTKRKLKRIQYRPHLLEGCLAETGLTLEMP
jgi:transposase